MALGFAQVLYHCKMQTKMISVRDCFKLKIIFIFVLSQELNGNNDESMKHFDQNSCICCSVSSLLNFPNVKFPFHRSFPGTNSSFRFV